MFRKSRIKIVTVIMSTFLLLFAGTLCIIYFFSYKEVSRQNREMLNRYAQAYWQNGNPSGRLDFLPELNTDNLRGNRVYRLLTFHSAAFSETGEVLTLDNDPSMGVSDEELTALAWQLVQKQKSDGVLGSWVYHMESQDGCILVVLMDNMIMSGNMGTLFRYTLLFGSITTVLLFLISLYFARRIVQPLEESYQKQKQFISDAGHELKTPISVISANAELLERKFGPDKWLGNVKFETGRMADLVRQLLELARTDNAVLPKSRVDFSRLVTGGVLPFESIAFEKERLLQTEIQEGIFLLGNAEQLGNLVSILVDNALSYAPRQSTVKVTLKTEHSRACLSVSNEGPAIPEEQQKSLFDRFYRADSSRGGDEPHYGLGLAIAKAIVTSHRGKIEVECRGGLIIFTASLPINS